MTPVKAVIFDLDGLLVDSEHVWHTVETELIGARGREYTDEVRAQVVGLRVDQFLAFLKKTYDFPDSVEELNHELLERFMRYVPTEVKSKPGAHEIVAYVHARDIRTAIASSSPMVVINAEVNAQGWERYFAIRCSADDDAKGKPAPDVYLRAAKILAADPADCIALEDSPNGARAAVAAGMTCYVVPDLSHSAPEHFASITPHVFPDLYAVLAKIRTMDGR